MAVMTTTGYPVHLIDARRYEQMVRAGLLEGQHVELIDGIITEMSPISPLHRELVMRLLRYLMTSQHGVCPQSSLEVAEDSVPEPDLALLASDRDLNSWAPTALLVIEVAISSLARDRGRKQELYAAAGIPVYWIVNGVDKTVEVYTEPGPDAGYRDVKVYRAAETVPPCRDDLEPLSVDALFSGI